ncbi:MAG TPA: hypothetical protein VFM34_02835 [Moraxellaceae bacterium]|nr:hypothetical protein [Moraxellaceae bacterium]
MQVVRGKAIDNIAFGNSATPHWQERLQPRLHPALQTKDNRG